MTTNSPDLFVAHHQRIVGIATFPDEAKELAERLAGYPAEARWDNYGELMYPNGKSTGYKILRMAPDAERRRRRGTGRPRGRAF